MSTEPEWIGVRSADCRRNIKQRLGLEAECSWSTEHGPISHFLGSIRHTDHHTAIGAGAHYRNAFSSCQAPMQTDQRNT
jgi:hypothetical protein